MMRRLVRSHIPMAIIGAFLIGCSNASLYMPQAGVNAKAEINFCTTPATAVVSKLKYLFVTDLSGSNQNNFIISGPGATPVQDTSCGAPPCGTDPTGVRRYSGLINFLQTNAANTNLTNVYYAGLFFSTSPNLPFGGLFNGAGPVEDDANSSIWYTQQGGVPVANTATYMSQQYTNIWCPASSGQTYPNCTQPQDPGGWTDYVDTLGTVGIYQYILDDLKYEQKLTQLGLQPQSTSSYIIFWTSDGFPYTATGPQAVGTILQDVQNIINLKSNQQYAQLISSISFNTAFYFTGDTGSYEYNQAYTLLSEMANVGDGAFIPISAGQDVPYSQFSIPPQTSQFVLRDLWVNDASSIWWNGRRMADTDNDGIPDQVETQWGSNPNAYDSDGNGIGDGVEYYLWGTPCGSITTANLGQSANPPGLLCNAAQKNTSFVSNGTCSAKPPAGYGDTDLDNLNDCEENLVGSNYQIPDSNSDFVPDQFEWLYNVAYAFGTNSLNADPAADNMTDYQKLKSLFPINVPVPQLNGVEPLTYAITQTSSNSTQSCYQAIVSNIPVMTASDVIRVYIMESYSSGGGNISRMRTLTNITKMNGSNTLTLNDSEFTP